MGVVSARSPLLVAGIMLGVGLGGFVDGIVLHQILQWHHLVSEPYPPETVDNLKLNTLLDGLFHAFTWVMTAVGLALLWRASKRPGVLWSTSALVGSLAIGTSCSSPPTSLTAQTLSVKVRRCSSTSMQPPDRRRQLSRSAGAVWN
jgi:uncharacterized membrane protein